MADPFDSIVASAADTNSNVLAQLRQHLEKWKTPPIPDLPPMQGGIAGLFSYELNSAFENVPHAKHNPFPVPALVLGSGVSRNGHRQTEAKGRRTNRLVFGDAREKPQSKRPITK